MTQNANADPRAPTPPAHPQPLSSDSRASQEAPKNLKGVFSSSAPETPATKDNGMERDAITSHTASIQRLSSTVSNPSVPSVPSLLPRASQGTTRIRWSANDRANYLKRLFAEPASSRMEMSASTNGLSSLPRPGDFWPRKHAPPIVGPSTIIGFQGDTVHRLGVGQSSVQAKPAHRDPTVSYETSLIRHN